MLELITPLILTGNEEANIGRNLAQLRWARDVVIVDSFSDDKTVEIALSFPQARIQQRKFDSHAAQWNFGLSETGINSEWVLALDADYILTDAFLEELERLSPAPEVMGYRAKFVYCINDKKLLSGIYPSVTVLYRRAAAAYYQDGHTQKLNLQGRIEDLHSRILHDDRKPFSRWLEAQKRYTQLEARKLRSAAATSLSWTDRIRRLRIVAPAIMLFYCLFLRGGILDGWAGFYYAFQRTLAELMLSIQLLDDDLRGPKSRDLAQEDELEKTAAERKVTAGSVATGNPSQP
jgi:glycosyltransferase involved in cell wall biosynthesis